MFNNPYMPNAYNPQTTIDKLNEQINNLERMKAQMQQPVQPTNLTQNFQIAPTNREVMRNFLGKFFKEISRSEKEECTITHRLLPPLIKYNL